MTAGPDLDAPLTPTQLKRAAAALSLDEAAYARAFELAAFSPSRSEWIRGAERFLLLFGIMGVLAGIAAFFAYNWDGLHRIAKFALIEAAIVGCVAATAWRGIDSAIGRGALFAAAFLVGTLFVVYGQAYQTGADPYGLFTVWALLIAGWVVIGRQAALWMLLLVLANLSLILYWTQVMRPRGLALIGELLGPLAGIGGAITDSQLATFVFVLNAGALVAWEWLSRRHVPWMHVRWWPRIVAVFALFVVVSGSLFFIFDIDFGGPSGALIVSGPIFFVAFAVASLWYYQFREIDLFILTATLVGGIVVVTSAIARGMRFTGPDVALMLALIVIAQTAGAAWWIRQIAARSREPRR